MSITAQIERIATNVSNAYAVVSELGGTLPEAKNTDNLEEAIRTIPSVDMIEPGGITSEASGELIMLTDAVDRPLKGLNLYGKTTQDGTPTPEAPVELVSAGNGGDIRTLILPAVKSLENDTLCGIPVTSGGNYTDETGQQWVCDEVDFGRGVYVQRVGKFVADGTQGGYNASAKWWYISKDFTGFDTTNRGMCSHLKKVDSQNSLGQDGFYISQTHLLVVVYELTSAAEYRIFLSENPMIFYGVLSTPTETLLAAEELASYAEKYGGAGTVYGRTTQDGTPSPEAPMELVNHADVCQSVLASTPNGLPGIPVTSGGNYTDETGQQWVCDEVDFSRGAYVQRVEHLVFDGSEGWKDDDKKGVRQSIILTNAIKGVASDKVSDQICSHFTTIAAYRTYEGTTGCSVKDDGTAIHFCYGSTTADANAWKNYLSEQYAAGNPVEVCAILNAPTETLLTAEELAAYAVLHTNYPNTTILNDGGAGMEVEYVPVKKVVDTEQLDVDLSAALDAVSDKGVSVPLNASADDLAGLIEQIEHKSTLVNAEEVLF